MLNSFFNMTGKVIILTGGSGHLGKKMAEILVLSGGFVIIAANKQEEFENCLLESSILKKNKNISFQLMDISSSLSIKNAFDFIFQEFGKIDVLINNAFYTKGSFPEDLSDEDWNYGVDGTLSSVFRCIREIIPFMKNTGEGNILNIASMYGIVSPDFKIYQNYLKFFNVASYGAAKAGVIQLTKYFAIYLADLKIRVNAISPGAFPSVKVQEESGFIEKLCEKIPLGRIGMPEDLQGAVLFLVSDASKYVTGQNVIIDGGWTIW